MSRKQCLSISVLIGILLLFITSTLKTQKKNFYPTRTTSVYTHHPLYYVSSEVSPDGRYRIDAFSGDYSQRYTYYQIFITNRETDETQRLYSSDFRTTDWKWTPSNKVKVIYNCGTGCRATKVIGVNESTAVSEEEQGMISEGNGWNVEFFKSF